MEGQKPKSSGPRASGGGSARGGNPGSARLGFMRSVHWVLNTQCDCQFALQCDFLCKMGIEFMLLLLTASVLLLLLSP